MTRVVGYLSLSPIGSFIHVSEITNNNVDKWSYRTTVGSGDFVRKIYSGVGDTMSVGPLESVP